MNQDFHGGGAEPEVEAAAARLRHPFPSPLPLASLLYSHLYPLPPSEVEAVARACLPRAMA